MDIPAVLVKLVENLYSRRAVEVLVLPDKTAKIRHRSKLAMAAMVYTIIIEPEPMEDMLAEDLA
jgi:hypothetical protein